MLKAGTILGNRYEIMEKIGAGGMAIVYRARDTKLERSVTVKVLRDEFIADDEFVARFKIEAQAAASLSHHNIVNVYDVGNEYDTYYIVMEYIHGFTLKELIKKESPFDNKKALNYALKIASALQHAHKNHIVHRDIKPQNILVTAEGELKVTDFGIAHAATSSTVTMTSTAIGSVHYFSPEQARGGYVDEKSDLYSLGIVMYEMVTGKLPFEGDSSVSIALKHINEDLPSIVESNPNVSKSIEKIIVKLTQKRVDQRYVDIDAMILDMNKALNDPTGNFIESSDTSFSATQKISDVDLKYIRDESKKEGNSDDEEDDYEEDDLDKSEEIKVIIAAVATAFAIIAIICVIAYGIINNKPKTSEKVIPNLVGKNIDEAKALLTDMDIPITITIGNEVGSETYDIGVIVNQSLPEGTNVENVPNVTVDVSTGNEKYEVPYVVNMEMKKAIETIEESENFIVDSPEYAFSDDIAVGVVISQDPEDKEMVKFGTKITLTISKGPDIKTVVVPNIVGLSETAAKAKIEANGLIVGTITSAESDSVEKGLVIKQLIAANKETTTNDIVGFVVSSGKAEVKPTEAETESQTEAQTEETTAGQAKTKSFNITKPTVAEGKTEVLIKMIKITDDSIETVYEQQHNVTEFPINVSVSGEGKAEIQLYIDKSLEWQRPVNFNE